MPAAGPDWSALLQLSLLLLALPAQYLIVNYSANNSHQTEKAIKQLVDQAEVIRTEYLSWPSWKRWCESLINKLQNTMVANPWATDHPARTSDGESPAVEVMKYDSPEGYFTNSPAVRSPRPSSVQFRVGQVIRHKKWGYKGVIIGWDATARAPETWLSANHPKGMERWRTQPNYSILVDTRDRPQQITYVPQENIQLMEKTKVHHPKISDYFINYDGRQYISRPGLKELYPDD